MEEQTIAKVEEKAIEGSKELSLVQVMNEQVVVSSRQVAENFNKQHKNVLQTIQNLAAENSAAKSFYYESTYENRGKQYPEYLMNRDGFSLLVMGFTGKEALEWKIKYINAFNAMEAELKRIHEEEIKRNRDPIEFMEATVQVLKEQRDKLNKVESDLKDLKNFVYSPFTGWNLQIVDHGFRLDKLENRIEDLGPAENIKSLIADAHKLNESIPYKDLYFQFYDSVKEHTGIDVHRRLIALRQRRREQGWSESRIKNLSLLDAITANPDTWPKFRDMIVRFR